MKKLLTVLAIVFALAFTACEKDTAPNPECLARYEQHIKYWDSINKTGTITIDNYEYLMKQFRLEYEQCNNN